jgi:hypothetical protein
MRVVVHVLNSIQGMDDDARFQICERYVVSGTIITGRKVLQSEGRQALEHLIEGFIDEVSPLLQRKPRSSEGETNFFLVRWYRALFRINPGPSG